MLLPKSRQLVSSGEIRSIARMRVALAVAAAGVDGARSIVKATLRKHNSGSNWGLFANLASTAEEIAFDVQKQNQVYKIVCFF
jgi:hypothetical protein